MKELFIPYEESLSLKELGFDEPCFGYYYALDNKKVGLEMYIDVQHQDTYFVQAPLYQQAFRWFREKYNLDSMVDRNTKDEYFGNKRYHKLSKDYETITKGFKTYEKAELELLKKLIEIIKNK